MTDISRRGEKDQIKGTRGRILALLREGAWTVDDLADRLAVTDNAVRFHLDALERAGTLQKQGVRRGTGAGQPAVLYTITAVGEEEFSHAYAPVLIAFLEELHQRMSSAQLLAFLKRVGKRLAPESPAASGSLSSRVNNAANLLNQLGGVTTVEKRGATYQIVGRACPLSRAVEADHCVCAAVTSLVAEVVGASVTERCDRSGRPKCCFEISSDHRARTTAHG
jgi:predicted ArsR family transcriptional regulator